MELEHKPCGVRRDMETIVLQRFLDGVYLTMSHMAYRLATKIDYL